MESDPNAQQLAETDRSQAIAALKAAKLVETNEPPIKTPEQVEKEAREIAAAPSTPDDTHEPQAPTAPQLTQDQQIKLRVRQEAQRIRAAAQQKLMEAEKRAAELDARFAQMEAEKSSYNQQKQELEALKRKAREAPKDFLSEAGTSLDEIVRGELENGKPDARLTNLERQHERQMRELQEFKDSLLAEKKQMEEAKAKQAEDMRIQQVKSEQETAERTFLKETSELKEYPKMAKLAKTDPIYALALAYAARNKFMVENGREPSMREIAATAEKPFMDDDSGDDQTAKTGGKRKGAPTSTAGAVGAPKSLDELTETQRRAEAVKYLKRERQVAPKQ